MSKTWWYLPSWGRHIRPVEVARHAEKSVWVQEGGSASRRNRHNGYFQTWEEAKASLVARRIRGVEVAEGSLRRAKELLAAAEALEKPQ